ncbi:GSCFA family protein [Nonlabens sp. Hel1_33_55]|uniref:GSCFA domain-containing protein n=1 Tax=Nonlabens sp. Hel1_33_55 TaxID=1336802 RepID=UPI000875C9CD|nr:GSCFA domain-containing protein [Nonlabens sp. Hel1_33_55]SCY16931.1 GSCFA family protein [Nonlabens sp. Hel1_33_55]
MKLTTSFEIDKIARPIDHNSQVVLLGSCFAQHIGDKLSYNAFQSVVNPFGVIFNPHSIAVLVEKSLKGDFKMDDVAGKFSYLAHSDLNGESSNETLENLKRAGNILKNQLSKASHLIITLGTSWIYELKESSTIVVNCHQQPQKLFDKRLLTHEEISNSLHKIEKLISSINPDIQLIYTVSPVRHIKDGMVENTRSKARLQEAIQQRCDHGEAYYFPSYEILMDELRDYRFYAGDMIHPNDTAVDYVWLRFRESALNPNTSKAITAIEKHQKLVYHRPKDSKAHQVQVEESRHQLLTRFPSLQI